MGKFTINLGDTQWSCRPTMGAALRFYEETGKEITEINVNSLTELCTYLWCCIASAANKEHREFHMTLLDFADSIDQNDLVQWANDMSTPQTDKPESKKKVKSKS